jgi:hypothetical protein
MEGKTELTKSGKRRFQLSEPLPLLVDIKSEIWLIIGFTVIAGLLIGFTRPFGLSSIETSTLIPFLFVVCFAGILLALLNRLSLPRLLPRIFDAENWTVSREILWSVWHLTGISILLYWAAVLSGVVHNGWLEFIRFLVLTLFLGGIDLLLRTYIRWNQHLRTNLERLQSLNLTIDSNSERIPGSHKETIKLGSGTDILLVEPDDFICGRADGNYVTVFVDAKDGGSGKYTQHLLRLTMSQLQEQTRTLRTFRTHRSWLVQPSRVADIRGNARGYTLVLNTGNLEVPVSRSYIDQVIPQFVEQ